MEAAIVGALLKATLPNLFKLIGDTCKQLEPDVRFIQSELEFMQAAFGDSRWRGNEISDLRRTWILQLRRLAHEIQDCIDNFQIKKTSPTQFAHEIADLKKRIQDSSETLHRYTGQGEPRNGKVAPNPTANDAEEDLLALVQNQSEMNAKVICAIGFGGQNTDLARRVYEKNEVRRQFGQRAWVSAVGRTVDDVLTEILRQLERRPGLGMLILSWLLSILCFLQGLLLKVFGTEMPVASRSGASSGIDHQLRSLLSKERYLIVIHDVTKEEVYNKICAFPWANRVGGRIIVTTDIQSAVRPCICDNDPPLLVPDSITSCLVLVGEVGTGMSYKETCSALCDAAVARMQCFVGSDYERIVVEDMLLYFSMFPLHHHEVAAEHLDILIGQNIVKSIKKSNNGKLKDFLRDNSVLETLAGIVIGNGMGFPQLLSDMGKLRKVKMWCDSMTNESTDLTGLKEGIKVFTSHRIRTPNVDYSLSVDFSGSSQSFLDCLEDPGMLTSLKLRGNLTRFRPVAARLVSLQELCLSWTNLSGAAIQIGLSNLRCQLKFLKLVENNLVGLAIQDKDAFVSLERICLVGMQSLEEIIIQDLRKLVSLHLLCPALGALPGIQIRKLQNLNEVGLHSQVDGDIKRGWEDAAVGHNRKLSIVSIGIQ
ncbi:unnamed protein product [Triticum aestivum]|uniref:(bread wheat) hypothetical protein n=1 Tax=Triticum aestivum TaxID=4565 RepID=A0A077RA90_WHEAT|nr:unnamed protein product [Triticum aestivum]CDM86788.1 unnamed protein product [Triticum aestivum]